VLDEHLGQPRPEPLTLQGARGASLEVDAVAPKSKPAPPAGAELERPAGSIEGVQRAWPARCERALGRGARGVHPKAAGEEEDGRPHTLYSPTARRTPVMMGAANARARAAPSKRMRSTSAGSASS
jgi:hypothetical protein